MASKRKSEILRQTVAEDVASRDLPRKAPELAEDRTGANFKRFRPSDKETVSTRMETRYKRILEGYARERGLKPAQVVSMWILERMKNEGLV